jgi:hypothetical protein
MLSSFWVIGKIRVGFSADGAPVAVKRRAVNASILLKAPCTCLDTAYNSSTRQGRAIAQAVSRRLPTAAARVRAQIGSCGIYGGQTSTGARFLRVLRFALPILIPPTDPRSSPSIIRGWYNRPVSGRRTKWTQSHPTSRNLKKIYKALHTLDITSMGKPINLFVSETYPVCVSTGLLVVLNVFRCITMSQDEYIDSTLKQATTDCFQILTHSLWSSSHLITLQKQCV